MKGTAQQEFELGKVGVLEDAGKIGIVGLGYVGLPLAAAFAEARFSVIGIDSDLSRIDALGAHDSYVEGVSSDRLRTLASSGRLRFTADYAALKTVATVIMCLPTPANEYQEPDTSALVSAARSIAPNLSSGALVVLESTSYPGTTREIVLPILEGTLDASSDGPQQNRKQVGRDFYLAFSPERVDPANRCFTVQNIPKLVSGVTPGCSQRAADLYETIIEEVHCVSTLETAETAKLLENTYRAVNIALANEFAVICNGMGIDVWEVIEAAKTKPFGFMPFYPGTGPGGHCIPVDPLYLSWRAQSYQVSTDLIDHACAINTKMQYYVANRILEALDCNEGSVAGGRVLQLGISYKPNLGDVRNSSAIAILKRLREHGLDVAYHDHYVPHLPEMELFSTRLTSYQISKADCVVIATDHESIDLRRVVEGACKVVDLCNAVRRRFQRLPENVEVL